PHHAVIRSFGPAPAERRRNARPAALSDLREGARDEGVQPGVHVVTLLPRRHARPHRQQALAICPCRRRRPVEIETARVKARCLRVSACAVATGIEVFEDRASGIWAGREAKLDEGARRLIDGEHPCQPVTARLDRMVVSQHGRFELSFPCARVVAVRMSQSVIVEACYRGITLASVGASEPPNLLVEIGYSLM